jgi:multidrug efflux pump subunit AcrB
MQQPEIGQYFAAIGGFQGGAVNTENIFITMKKKSERPLVGEDKHRETQQDFMNKVRKQFASVPGINRVSILDFSQTGFSAQRGYPIQVMVQGRADCRWRSTGR